MKKLIFTLLALLLLKIGCFSQTPCHITQVTTGPFAVCQQETGYYSTAGGMSNYFWSVSEGNIIQSGQGTSGVIVQWLVPGTQTIHVRYSSPGCGLPPSPVVRDVTVYANTASITPLYPVFCAGSSVTLFANTGAGLSYQWRKNTVPIPGATSSSYEVTEPDWYNVLITTENGCSRMSNTVYADKNYVNPGSIGDDQTICPGGAVAQFTEGYTSGKGNLTYQWQQSADNITYTDISGANGWTYRPLNVTQKTYYKRIVTSTWYDVPCSGETNAISVSVNNGSGGSIAGDQTICNGATPAAFSQTVASTGTALTYQWQKAAPNSAFVDIAGETGLTYTPPAVTGVMNYQRITKSTLNNTVCSYPSNSLSISFNNVTPGTIANNQTICSGNNPVAFTETAASGGSGNRSYQWQRSTNGSSFTTIPGATGLTYDESGALNQTTWYNRKVTYSVTGLQCSATTAPVTVTVLDLPAVSASNKSVCAGNSVALTGSPAGGSWSGTGVSGSTFHSSGLSPGNYTVTYSYTNSNNCTNSATSTVTIEALPGVAAANEAVCTGNSVALTATPSGGSWSGTGVSGSSFNASGLAAGNYVVTYSYTNSAGCTNNTSATITVNALPVVTADNKSTCYGNSVPLTGTPSDGTWSGTGVNGSNFNSSGLSAGDYIVTYSYTNPNGCTNSKNATVTVMALPGVTANPTSVCSQNVVALTGSPSGGTWSGTGVTGSNFNSSGLAAGNYVVTYSVTDANGCIGSADTTVTVHALPTVVADNKVACKGKVVALTGSPAGGTWSGSGVIGSNFYSSEMSVGTHTVSYTYSDSNGCSNTDTGTVSVLETTNPTAANKSVCAGSVVALTGSPTGGTWSGPGVNGSNFHSSGLSAGNYTVYYSYTNASRCTSVATATVTVVALPVITSFTGTAAVCPGNTYEYRVSVSGTGYTYTWTKPSNWYIQYQSAGTIALQVPQYNPNYGAVTVKVTKGSCSNQAGLSTYPGSSCGGYSYYSYRISPNPANTEMSIETDLATETDSHVNIYSAAGRLYQATAIGKGKNMVKVNTSELPNGLYIVEIKGMGGKSEYKRVIIAH